MDQVDLRLGRCNTALGLLLESMQYVHNVGKAHRVNGAESIAIIPAYHLDDGGVTKALQRLGIRVLVPLLRGA